MILRDLGIPRAQLNERSALTLLALLDLEPTSAWAEAANPARGITEMMDWFRLHYRKAYKPNTRETVRRQTMHQFVEMGLAIANPDKPDRPVNSPYYAYILDPAAVKLMRSFGTVKWLGLLGEFRNSFSKLKVLHHHEREMAKIAVTLPDGSMRQLTAGGQNVLIQSILSEFCSRFTHGGRVLYLGDAGGKLTPNELAEFGLLGIKLSAHGKMPDVVVYLPDKNWLVLVEAVTSHGPVDNKRKLELQALMKGSTAGLVFVTAVPDRKTLTKFLGVVAWETEVWVAENPTHMIHFNGERFLGPYAS